MAYYDKGSGIGIAKVLGPSPGWRGCIFSDGNTHYVAHVTMKTDNDAERKKDIETASAAKAEHTDRKRRKNGTNATESH